MPLAKWAVPVFDYLIDLMAKNMSGARQDRFLEFGMDKPIFFVQYL
jgi:hypothetical protein